VRDPLAPIWLAIKRVRNKWSEKRFEELKELIKTSPVDLNTRYRLADDESLLYFVVKHGFTRIAEAFLNAGASVTYVDAYGRNLLGAALLRIPNLTLVRLLLQRGCDPNEPCPNGYTAVHHAARTSVPSILETVLKARGRVNARSHHGATPLHSAVDSNIVTNLCLLLQYGADPDAADDQNITALARVLRGPLPNIQIVSTLLYYGAKPRKEDLELCVSEYSKNCVLPELERAMGIVTTTPRSYRWPYKLQNLA
jgi:hypothetical protein